MSSRTTKYVDLIRRFLDDTIQADDFEARFLDYFKNEHSGMSSAEFLPLERLFTAVDAYCPDASLRSDDDLDEGQLRVAAKSSLNVLEELGKPTDVSWLDSAGLLTSGR